MKFTKIKIFLICLFILGIASIPYLSSAEMQIEAQEGDINIDISPNNPQPYQDVTIRVSSYATDLNKASITWLSGTETVLSGIGKASYSFKALGPNTNTIISINIIPPGSMSTINKKIIIAPSEIEIMWESVAGYTPPFYRGKSLPVNGSFIRAVAIPNTNTIKSGSGSITYTWKSEDSTVLAASGYNKNSYVFKNNMFKDRSRITVNASSVEGDYVAENTVEIPLYKPKIIFYKKSPTEGVLYNNALNIETTMIGDEMTLVSEPYYLPIKSSENFTYSWKINGESINTPTKKTELTIRPNSRGGYATVGITIENMDELFQKISNQLKINL